MGVVLNESFPESLTPLLLAQSDQSCDDMLIGVHVEACVCQCQIYICPNRPGYKKYTVWSCPSLTLSR